MAILMLRYTQDISVETITYVSLAKLQPSLSYESHTHRDHEEIDYIIRGKGRMKIGNEEARFRDGDVIYIPEKTSRSIINDGEEMVDLGKREYQKIMVLVLLLPIACSQKNLQYGKNLH